MSVREPLTRKQEQAESAFDSPRTRGHWSRRVRTPLVVLVGGGLLALIAAIHDLRTADGRWMLPAQALLLLAALAILGMSLRVAERWKLATSHRPALQPGPGADANRQYDRLIALLKVTRLLGSQVDPQQALDGITRTAMEVLDCEQVSLMLLENDTEQLVVRSAAGHPGTNVMGAKVAIGKGVAGRVAETGEPLVIVGTVDRSVFREVRAKPYDISTSMVVPIRLREELIGVLCVSRRSPGHLYDSADLHLLQVFAEVVAVCIRHAEQATWMRDTIRRLEIEVTAGGRHGDGTQDVSRAATG